jgi:hypothetical protein
MGTFLPVTLFVVLTLIFVMPLFPVQSSLLNPLEYLLGIEWRVILIILVAIVLSTLLYNLNIPIIRVFEGYPWKDSLIGQLLTTSFRRKFRAAPTRTTGLRTALLAIEDDEPYKDHFSEIVDLWDDNPLKINYDFPLNEDGVLPTRLGNAIRSFEDYPERQYGIDAVTIWPRLVAKVDKDYVAGIDNAKTSFDFMLNMSVLSAVMALLLLSLGLF